MRSPMALTLALALAAVGCCSLLLQVVPGADAFLVPAVSSPRVMAPTLAAGAAAARPASQLFSSPMDDFDPAEREAAVVRIKELVAQNKVMLFMKGTKLFPQCGFSNTAVSILRAVDAEFETFDVLSDPLVREEIKKFSNWPTIPQCFIGGDFVGGSDILLEMFESGELETMLADAAKA